MSARRAITAAVCLGVIAWASRAGGLPMQMARAADAATLRSSSPSLADELSQLGALKFSTRLQDAADENVFSDLPAVVTITHVVVDFAPCHISYQRQFQLEGDGGKEQRSFALGDIAEVKVEPFESFENEHQGKPGWVYTMTEPKISAVLITHVDGSIDWFAVASGEMAKHLAEDIQRRGSACRRHAAP